MQTSIPQPPASPTWAEAIDQAASTDDVLTEMMTKIISLEEALSDRRARRRLRRSIASSARMYSWAGSFAAARWEAFSAERTPR